MESMTQEMVMTVDAGSKQISEYLDFMESGLCDGIFCDMCPFQGFCESVHLPDSF